MFKKDEENMKVWVVIKYSSYFDNSWYIDMVFDSEKKAKKRLKECIRCLGEHFGIKEFEVD